MSRLTSSVLSAIAGAAASITAANGQRPRGRAPAVAAAALIDDAAGIFMSQSAAGRTYLYVESPDGERLCTLDATNPARPSTGSRADANRHDRGG